MRSRLTDDFVALFGRLPEGVQAQARRAYGLWRRDPWHPGLHFRRVHTHEPVHSVRVGLGWRALALVDGNLVTWFWIGSHAEYDALLRRL